jgi:NhaP-type Na+/H+ or K+/H+ antiporter
MTLKSVKYQQKTVFEFSPTFLISISILALVMIIFDGTSRFKLKELNLLSDDSAKIVWWFLITNTIIVTTATVFLFYNNITFQNVLLSLIFAVIMTGTDPAAIFSLMKEKSSKIIKVLEIESIFNTPIIVIIPFILMQLLTDEVVLIDSLIEQLIPFLKQIVIGIGSGILIGIIIFKAMKNYYDDKLSHLGIIIAALLSYILAENLGGNGVLSVATMGLFFGSIYLKQKIQLLKFSSILSNSLQILVFILVGFLVNIDFTTSFFIKSIILFSILLLSRKIAVSKALKDYNKKEKWFMTLNFPKGIAVATVVFSLSMKEIVGMKIIIDLILMFMIYSLSLSTIVEHYSDKFIKEKV